MKKKLIYEVVYDEIKRRIEQEIWKPGDRLPTLAEISEELQVGISSVREAVRILGKQKILTVEQGRGTFISNQISDNPNGYLAAMERASWMQLTEARLVMEPELAALAAEKASMADKEAILKSAEAMQRKVKAGKPFLKEDIEFHELIAKASNNDILIHMINMVGDVLLDSRRHTMRIPGMNEKASSYHYLIAQAIMQSHPQQARELMRLHLIDMRDEWTAE
ncbi:FadR/GntR family transcriptional regulator [Paenibacillus nasutitermitis]|uniref:GntR family transcriptional regulator n=1 Tax=Paenibacillus nasutitermitis TaxID=1652958 RepID=A0A916ZAU1_9BACL|nr:FCD domain-containing protein [Paenibacillus nasutitermitis]GGD84458.1 GntR family transcriptional regulator [Paenibacillus nasutitermitis]